MYFPTKYLSQLSGNQVMRVSFKNYFKRRSSNVKTDKNMKVHILSKPNLEQKEINDNKLVIIITWIGPLFLCSLIIWKGIDVSLSPQFPPHYGCVITCAGLACALYQESTHTILSGLIHTCVWILKTIRRLKATNFE
jgi:hypothetical protein